MAENGHMHAFGKSVLMKYFDQVGFCLHIKILLLIWFFDTTEKLSTYIWSL